MSIDCSDCIDIIALYVDDLLIASSRTSELLAIKRRLTQQYEMEDMGEATFILGIDIKRDRANRTISIGPVRLHQHAAGRTRHD